MSPYLADLLAVEDVGEQTDAGGTEGGEAVASARRLRLMPLSLRWACKEAVLKYFGFGLRLQGGTRQVVLPAREPDGRFSWRPGAELRRHAPAADRGHHNCFAQEIDGYSLAMVWQ